MQEIWKDIKGYEGLYQISNFGRIKSLSRRLNSKPKRILKEKILKSRINYQGYYSIVLHKNCNKKEFKIHRLVALYFIKNINNKNCINHIDGNKLNNRTDNLEWCTLSENTKHAIAYGLINNQGINNGNAILNRKEVIKIKKLLNKGNKQKDLAIMFNVSYNTINDIKYFRSWKHIFI